MTASSEDMRVACKDGNLLAMTAITGGAAVSYMTADDMGVACADGNLLEMTAPVSASATATATATASATGNLLEMTAITGGADGAAWSVVCVNRALATASATASASAPSTMDGLSFVACHRRHNGLPTQHSVITTRLSITEPITVRIEGSEYVTYIKLTHMSNTDQRIHV